MLGEGAWLRSALRSALRSPPITGPRGDSSLRGGDLGPRLADGETYRPADQRAHLYHVWPHAVNDFESAIGIGVGALNAEFQVAIQGDARHRDPSDSAVYDETPSARRDEEVGCCNSDYQHGTPGEER